MALIKCPECDAMTEETDQINQKVHMENNHPEVIKARLVREGFWDHKNNRPWDSTPTDPLWKPGQDPWDDAPRQIGRRHSEWDD